MRPMRARLCLGKGACCSVLLKFLRPSKVDDEAFVNPTMDQRLNDLIAVSREVTTGGEDVHVDFLSKQNHPLPAPFCRAMGNGR